MSAHYPGRGPPGSYPTFQPGPPSNPPPPGVPPPGNPPVGQYPPQQPGFSSRPPGQPGMPVGSPAYPMAQNFAAPSRGPPPGGIPLQPPNPSQVSSSQVAHPYGGNGSQSLGPGSYDQQPGAQQYRSYAGVPPPLGPPPTGTGGFSGPPPSSGPTTGMPPPPVGNSPSMRSNVPPSAKVQFYSVAGGSPTPVASAAPPTGLGAPPGAPQEALSSLGTDALGGQFSRMGFGAPAPPSAPSDHGIGPGVAPQTAYPGMGAGYTAAPSAYGGSFGGTSTTSGPSVSTTGGVTEQLPNIADMDMTIQSDPRIMRMTIGEMPNSATLLAQCNIPMGVIIQPMALDDQVPPYGGCELVNFGPQGIVRCKRCRTYINPFVSWLNNGRQWRCNVCGMINDVPTSYFCHLDADGMRRDRFQRPELARGSVEIQAPAEYMVRPPVPPVYFFVLDVSLNAVNCGMVSTAVVAIKQCLDSLPGNDRTQFGLITFDSSIHFYNLKSSLTQPQMLVVSDISDLFLPCPDDLLVNMSESRNVIDGLLDSLAEMHRSTRNVDSALGSALNAASKVMAHLGGKMIVFSINLPSIGEGKLKHRENPRLLGTDKEHTMLKPDDPWYQTNSQEFSKLQICVDLFLFGSFYMDVATLGQLPNKTGGQLFYYPGFNSDRDGVRFTVDLMHVLSRATAFESVMRVRATRGIRMANFYGNYFIRGTDLLALPNCSPDSVFAVELAYDEQILSASVVSIQAALLYTTSTGERRIRVHNIAIPVKTVIQEIFNSVSIDAMCNLLAKQALDVAINSGFDAARSRIQEACVDILRASRGGSYGGYPGSQQPQGGSGKVLESIELLPLYTMALQKNPVFRGGAEIRPDERAYLMSQLTNMSVEDSRAFIYPRMFSLHDMPSSSGTPATSDAISEGINVAGRENLVVLPPAVNLSAERLTSDGIFLLENGVSLNMWIGRSASRTLVNSLVGVPSVEGIDVTLLSLLEPPLDSPKTDVCVRVNAVIEALREERPQACMPLSIMGEGDGQIEYRFFWHLVEDRAPFAGGGMSYAEYMQHVTRQSFGALG